MNFNELLKLYENNKNTIQQNDNGDWDFDVAPQNIHFDLDGLDFNPDARTRKLEETTINTLQDIFTQPGWELKNATNGINFDGVLLVEHHQHKKIENELVPSGVLISKAGYWWFGIDDIGFIVLKRDFLVWCYNFNLKTKLCKDGPIESQQGWNTGYAFFIRYTDLPYLFKKYKEQLLLDKVK
jgi:hypothetical protein